MFVKRGKSQSPIPSEPNIDGRNSKKKRRADLS